VQATRRDFILGAGSALAATALGQPALAQSAPYKLGWIAAVSGFGATNAQGQDFGFRAAVQDANDDGGIGGRKFEIVMRDSASEASKAAGFAKELVFNENVDVLCGPSNSAEVLPTLATTTRAKKIQMVGGSFDQVVNPEKYPYDFRYLNRNVQWIEVAVRTMATAMKRKSIAIINDNTAYGPVARDAVIDAMKAFGLKPVYVGLVDVNKPDLTEEIVKARDAGADIVTQWSVASGFIARLLNARGEQGWKVPVVGHPNLLQTEVAKLLSKPEYWASAYGIGYTHLIVGPDGKLPPATQAFFDRHKDALEPARRTGISALLQGHSAATLYIEALKRANGDPDSAKVKQAFESGKPFDPPFGRFVFSATDHNGYGDDNIVLVEASEQKPNGGYPPVSF